MERLFETVKCNECKFILHSPVNLPCGNTICEKHVRRNKSYDCGQCGNEHNVPVNGFPSNDAINFIIDTNEYKRVEKAFESLKTLKMVIDQLESLKNEPKREISNRIGELKSQVCSSRDELIREIEMKSERMILELETYESECMYYIESFG